MTKWLWLVGILALPAFARDGLELGLPCPCSVIQHTGFSLCYNEEHEQAEWVAYVLTAVEVKSRRASRKKMRWEEDPLVRTGSAAFADYRQSGFDKGHLIPAADLRWSAEGMRESFLLSNASPQRHDFNAGVWEEIENAVRNFAVAHDSVYVVTGPVLRKGLPKIGRDHVSVPQYFYKVVLAPNGPSFEAIGFVCRNEPSSLPITYFAVPVDSVESMIGFDFFNALPDSIENPVERTLDVQWWLPEKRKLPRR